MKHVVIKGTLTVEKVRGVVYFHDEKGICLLRLEGLKNPDPDVRQIDVRLRDAHVSKDLEGRLMTAEVIDGKVKGKIG